MTTQTEQQTQTLNTIIKEQINKANKYRQEKRDCCLCNPESEKEFLCCDCIKIGWKFKEVLK